MKKSLIDQETQPLSYMESGSQATGLVPAQSLPKVNADTNVGEWTSAEQSMALAGAGAVGNIAASYIGGKLNQKENEKARIEARQIAEMNRADTLKQQGIENAFSDRVYKNEEKEFVLKKIEDKFNLKINRAIMTLKNNIDNRNKLMSMADNFANIMKTTNLQDMLATNYQGVQS